VKSGGRIALGVTAGYFLGRTKKMKLALMLGGWAAGRQMGGPGQILGQAGRMLGENPQLSELTDQVRGRLLEAGKGAAMAVATRQVEALTDRLGRGVEQVGGVGRVADLADIDLDDVDLDVGDDYDGQDEEQPVRRTRRARTSDNGEPRSSRGSRSPSGSSSSGGSRSSGNSRASGTSRSSGGSRAAGQRSSPAGRRKPSRSSASGRTSGTATKAAKRESSSSARTQRKSTIARKASRTTRTRREGSDG
jgi:hypothetical protein